MSADEMAKLHVRHMVGGLARIRDERLCRFEFPERPGALLDFLKAIGVRWNISLFHYRNHGSDFGRVLAGVQVADADLAEFRAHLAELGYPWWDENGESGVPDVPGADKGACKGAGFGKRCSRLRIKFRRTALPC